MEKNFTTGQRVALSTATVASQHGHLYATVVAVYPTDVVVVTDTGRRYSIAPEYLSVPPQV